MDDKSFLNTVLGDGGHYCTLALNPERNIRAQSFYDSVDGLCSDVSDLDEQGHDIYFALATFHEGNSRKVDNIKELRSLFLDLDCGEGKDFVDQEDAITQLKSFCSDNNLPRPILVDSGRGIHVYWAFSDPVPYEEWFPVADLLKRRCSEADFFADPAVTADGARVLRVPDTHNHKTDPPSPVKLLTKGELPVTDFDAFAEALGINDILVPTVAPSYNSALMDKLMGNRESVFKDIMLKTQEGRGCEQLEIIATDQENCSEPMWRAGLSIAKFCSDGDKAAHIISKGHEEYTPELTQGKLELIKGPYLCTTFDEHNPDVCPDCPHFGNIKSPITLGNKIKEAPVEESLDIPEYPDPYFRGANGGVYLRTSTMEGDIDEKLIYENDLYVVRRILDPDVGESIFMRLHLPEDGVREFTVPLTAVTSREEFRKTMATQGVALLKMDELMQYTTTWVQELQQKTSASKARTQFGWTDDKFTSFVLGDKEIFADRIDYNPPSVKTAGLFHAFEPKGTLQDWKEMANFYNRPAMEMHQYVACTGFGSILMPMFGEVKNSMLNIHSTGSGHGKTTAMEVSASVWGRPDDLVLEYKDTGNSLYLRAEVYKNLPFLVDEISNMRPEEASTFCYAMTSGKQRNRMTSGSNEERKRGEPWYNMGVATSNACVIEKAQAYKQAPQAEAQRVMSYPTKRHAIGKEKEKTSAFAVKVKNTYGTAGIIFAQYVMNNLEEVRKTLYDTQRRIDREAGLTAENRFWSAGVAATITSAIIAKKIGLISYDIKALYRWSLTLLAHNKKSIDEMAISLDQIISDYIMKNHGKIIQINSTDDLRKQQGNGLDELVIPDMMPRGELVGRYEPDTNLAFLMPTPLKKHCQEEHINYGQLVKDLKEKKGARNGKKRITKGTPMKGESQVVLIFKCSLDEQSSSEDT